MAVDRDTLFELDPRLALTFRWAEAFGEELPTVILAPADYPVIEEALEAGDPEIFWSRIRAELEAGMIR